MKLSLVSLTLAFSCWQVAMAQIPVPQVQLPPSIIAELKRVESKFENALAQDCPGEKCFSRGCNYLSHETVDKPKSASLPGLGDPQAGPGSAPAQEYLKAARCEFAFENTLAARDIAALQRRLEQKLSVGFLMVSISPKPLPPLPESLRATPAAAQAAPAPAPDQNAGKASELAKQSPDWNASTALRELWLQLLPHFSWMIAIVLTTLAALTLLWAWRRVGKETLEEKALLASLQGGAQESNTSDIPQTEVAASTDPEPPVKPKSLREVMEKIHSRPEQLTSVVKHWLDEKNYAALSKALFVFGDAATEALAKVENMAIEKSELAAFVNTQRPEELPSDELFAESVEKTLVSSRIETLPDVGLYRSLARDFGPQGLARLLSEMPPRLSAISLAILPRTTQSQVVSLFDQNTKVGAIRSLLTSNRASAEDIGTTLDFTRAALAGRDLPKGRTEAAGFERGRPIDTSNALSVLLASLPAKERKDFILEEAKKGSLAQSAQVFSSFVFFPEMLLKLSRETRSSLFLDVEPRDLFVWMGRLSSQLKAKLMEDIPATLQGVMKTFAMPSSESEVAVAQAKVDKRFLDLLGREYGAGRVRFEDLI